ncbi:MAG: glycosyltransferase family 39 protein [Saprospiraceae bacterium]|nr:glycosyltransferase family 39 protein [Saprospiraceae bacterium]
MEKSPAYNPFYWLVGLIFIANLLLFNDWLSWQPLAEIELLGVASENQSGWLPGLIQHTFLKQAIYKPFLIRLPSVLLLLITFRLMYAFGKPLFGTKRIINSLLVLSVSWMILPIGKLASADSLLFSGLILALLCALHFLKSGQKKWRYGHFAFLLIAFWTNPWVTSLVLLLFDQVVYITHPTGKRILQLWHWAILPVLFLGTWLCGGFPFPQEWFYADLLNGYIGRYAAWNMLGVLPFWGFLFAGLWQAFSNLRKGEEWAKLILAFLIAGLFFGPLLQFAFSLAIARSLDDYAHPNYPYRSIVRGFSLLGLLSVFCLGALGMLNGFYWLQASGFRAAMAICIGFWVPYFFAILGLWSLREGQYRNMAVLAGGVSFFFLLVQFMPIYEGLHSWQKDIPNQISTSGYTTLQIGGAAPGKSFEYYANRKELQLQAINSLSTNGIRKDWPLLVDSVAIQRINVNSWSTIDTFPDINTWWYLLLPE